MRTLFSLVIVISGLILGCDNAVSPTSTLPAEEITEHDMWGYLSGKWELSEPVGFVRKQSFNFDGSTRTIKFQETISTPARTITLPARRTIREGRTITIPGRTINIPARTVTINSEYPVKTYKKGNVEVISMDRKTSVLNYTVQRKNPNNMIWTLIPFTKPPLTDPPKSLEPVTIDGKRRTFRYHRVHPR